LLYTRLLAIYLLWLREFCEGGRDAFSQRTGRIEVVMVFHSAKLEKYSPSSQFFDINEFPFYWIARVNALYSQEMEKTLKPMGMDIARWRVAVMLRVYGPLSISDIAEHAIGKLPTITKIVYRMRDAGLVEVNASETDGRVTVVSLTEEGHDKVKMVFKTTEKKVFADRKSVV